MLAFAITDKGIAARLDLQHEGEIFGGHDGRLWNQAVLVDDSGDDFAREGGFGFVVERGRIDALEVDIAPRLVGATSQFGDLAHAPLTQIGRSSCWERVCQYV